MDKIEILAPAGSLDILKTAVDAGADAVYTGVGIFNARMNANNLTMDELNEGCQYAHRKSSKVYLTLNTLVNSAEIDEAVATAGEAYNNGVDGILVQDVGLALEIRKRYPVIPVHASTQMNVFSSSDYKKLSEMGIKRVVLPREMSMDEISFRTSEARKYSIETEVFVHGAVCVSASGLCLYSSMNKSGTRSGNRGLCAQPCRQCYSLYDGKEKIKEGHLISPKDRSAAKYLSQLIDCGVSSLKIEGRMRDAAYVATVVAAYRKLVDAYYDGYSNPSLDKKVKNELLVNFNRGGSFTSQNLSGTKATDFLSGEFVGKYGLKLGQITRTDKHKGVIEFSYSDKLPMPDKGDYLSIRDNDKELFSFPIGKIHEAPNRLTVKGLHPDSIDKIKGNPDIYLMSHDSVKLSAKNSRKTNIDIKLDVQDGFIDATATVIGGINADVTADYTYDIESGFEGNPVTQERVTSQMMKTGDTPFNVINVVFENDNEIKCPISSINELRRCLIESLISAIDYECEHSAIEEFIFADDAVTTEAETGTTTTLYVFPSVKSIKGDLRRDCDLYGFTLYDLAVRGLRGRIVDFINGIDAGLVMVLPDMYHDNIKPVIIKTIEILKETIGDKFVGVMDSDVLGDSSFATSQGLKHFLSAGSNLFNEKSINNAVNSSDAGFISYELSPDEALESIMAANIIGKTVIVHAGGPIAWMQSDFCPLGCNKTGCKECFDRAYTTLKDEGGEGECKVISHSLDCSSIIYGNPKYTYDYDAIEAITNLGVNVIECYTEI